MNSKRYCILIASSQFPHEDKLTNLQSPENDVDGLHKILSSTERGGFSDTFVLKNKAHHEILRTINRVLKTSGKNDFVMIYYSGHGKLNPAGRLHLTTSNTVINELESTSIPIETIRNYVDVSKSNSIALILDCCFSGAAGAAFARGGVDDQLQLTSGGRGTYILTASTGIQVAMEKESDQYGVFTKHLIQGLASGDADLDSDGQVTMEELYRYVHERVLEEGHQEPMKWDLNVRGDLVVARSGKKPRQIRNNQIREMLSDLWGHKILPDDILDTARQVIEVPPTEQTTEQKAHDELLEKLLKKEVAVGEFLRAWDQVTSAPVIPQAQGGIKPAKPAASELTTSTPAQDHTPPVEGGQTKKRVIALAVFLLFAVAAVIWYATRQVETEISDRKIHETATAIEALSKELGRLEQAINTIENKDDANSIRERLETLQQKLQDMEQNRPPEQISSKAAGLTKKLNQLQNRLEAKTKKLDIKAPPQTKPEQKTARLLFKTRPDNTRIRILDPPLSYVPGMTLAPGKYKVEVSAPDHKTTVKRIDLYPGQTEAVIVTLSQLPVQDDSLAVRQQQKTLKAKLVRINSNREAIERQVLRASSVDRLESLDRRAEGLEKETADLSAQSHDLNMAGDVKKELARLAQTRRTIALAVKNMIAEDAAKKTAQKREKKEQARKELAAVLEKISLKSNNISRQVQRAPSPADLKTAIKQVDLLDRQINELKERAIGLGLAGSIDRIRGKLADLHKRIEVRSKQLTVSKKPPKTYTNNIGMKFVLLPAGKFKMGSPKFELGRERDEILHTVVLTNGFYMQTTEVTQAQWKAVMGDKPAFFKSCGDNCPVERVSWRDAQRFIQKLNRREPNSNYRLPTEAEWEYAARAGRNTAFGNGPITVAECEFDGNLHFAGWYCGNSNDSVQTVAQKHPNNWGLYDMHGNVAEWVQDWYGSYSKETATDPKGPPSGKYRVFRGGSWKYFASNSRSANRRKAKPDKKDFTLGFRLLKDIGK